MPRPEPILVAVVENWRTAFSHDAGDTTPLTARVYLTQYVQTPNPALFLEFEYSMASTVASVNLPGYRVPEGFILIKDWSENEGTFAALADAGIIAREYTTVPAGFTEAKLVKLLKNEAI